MACKIKTLEDMIREKVDSLRSSKPSKKNEAVIAELNGFLGGLRTPTKPQVGPRVPTLKERAAIARLETQRVAKEKELALAQEKAAVALKEQQLAKELEAKLAREQKVIEESKKAKEEEVRKAEEEASKLKEEIKSSQAKARAAKLSSDKAMRERDAKEARANNLLRREKLLNEKNKAIAAQKEVDILTKKAKVVEAKVVRQAKVTSLKTKAVNAIQAIISKIKEIIRSLISKINGLKFKPKKQKTFEESLPEYYTKLFDTIDKKQNIVLDMDINFAKKVIYDEMVKGQMVKGTAYKNKIHLPDFEALKADKGELKSFIKTIMGDKPSSLITPETITTLIDQHIEAEKKHSVKLHEAIHVATVQFMKANPNDPKTVAIESLFKKMQIESEKDGSILNSANNAYWKTNVFEFIAEALSHEVLIKEMNKIMVGKESLLHRLINVFRRILGITNNSATDVLLNTVLKMNDFKSPNNNYTEDYLKVPKGSVMEMNRVDEYLGMVNSNKGHGTNISDIIENIKFFGGQDQFLIKVGKTEGEFMNYVRAKFGGKPLADSEVAIDSKTRVELAKIPNTLPLMYSNDTSKTTKKGLYINVKEPISPTETYLNEYLKDVKPTDSFLNGLTPKELLDGVKGVVDTSLVNSTRVSIIQYNNIKDTVISTVAERFLDGKALTDDIVEDISNSESKRKDVTNTSIDTSENNKSNTKEVSRATSNTENSNVETNEIINSNSNSDSTSRGNSSTTEYDIDETHTIKNSKVVTNKTVNQSGTNTSEDGGGNITHKSGTIKRHYILENSLQINTLITNGSITQEQRSSSKPILDNLLSTDTTTKSETFEYKGTNIDISSSDGVNYSFMIYQEGKDSLLVDLKEGILTKLFTPITNEIFQDFETAMNKLGISYFDFDSEFSIESNQSKYDKKKYDEAMVEYNKSTFNGVEMAKDDVLSNVKSELKKVNSAVNIEFVVDGTNFKFDSSYGPSGGIYFEATERRKPTLGSNSKFLPTLRYILQFADARNKINTDPDNIPIVKAFSDLGIDVNATYRAFLPFAKSQYVNYHMRRYKESSVPLASALGSISSESPKLSTTKISGDVMYRVEVYLSNGKLHTATIAAPLPTVVKLNPRYTINEFISHDLNGVLDKYDVAKLPNVNKVLKEFGSSYDKLIKDYSEAIKKDPIKEEASSLVVQSTINTSNTENMVYNAVKGCN